MSEICSGSPPRRSRRRSPSAGCATLWGLRSPPCGAATSAAGRSPFPSTTESDASRTRKALRLSRGELARAKPLLADAVIQSPPTLCGLIIQYQNLTSPFVRQDRESAARPTEGLKLLRRFLPHAERQ